MKQQIIYKTIFALALSSQLVFAGDITDTYSSGDTLTATMLDNIKSAVNDNDASVTANEADISDLQDAISLSQIQTRYSVLPGIACIRNPADTPYWNNYDNSCVLANQTTDTPISAFWAVSNIPNGATILGFSAHLFTWTGETTCTLRRGLQNTATAFATITDSTGNWHSTTEAILAHVVDTATYAYSVRCDNTLAHNSNTVGHIRIRYIH